MARFWTTRVKTFLAQTFACVELAVSNACHATNSQRTLPPLRRTLDGQLYQQQSQDTVVMCTASRVVGSCNDDLCASKPACEMRDSAPKCAVTFINDRTQASTVSSATSSRLKQKKRELKGRQGRVRFSGQRDTNPCSPGSKVPMRDMQSL